MLTFLLRFTLLFAVSAQTVVVEPLEDNSAERCLEAINSYGQYITSTNDRTLVLASELLKQQEEACDGESLANMNQTLLQKDNFKANSEFKQLLQDEKVSLDFAYAFFEPLFKRPQYNNFVFRKQKPTQKDKYSVCYDKVMQISSSVIQSSQKILDFQRSSRVYDAEWFQQFVCLDQKTGSNVCLKDLSSLIKMFDADNECPILHWAMWLPFVNKDGFTVLGNKEVIAKRVQFIMTLINQATINAATVFPEQAQLIASKYKEVVGKLKFELDQSEYEKNGAQRANHGIKLIVDRKYWNVTRPISLEVYEQLSNEVVQFLSHIFPQRVFFVFVGHSNLLDPPQSTGNEDFKLTNYKGYSVHVFSIRKPELQHQDEKTLSLKKTIVQLWREKLASGQVDIKELLDNFGEVICVRYALINSYGMIGVESENNQHLIQVGGQPNIWIVSNCFEK